MKTSQTSQFAKRNILEWSKEHVKNLQREMLARRYQKWARGEATLSDKLSQIASKSKAHLVTRWRDLIKQALDISLAIVGLIGSLPVLLVIAIMIKLDSKGPVFLKQTRVGLKGKCFTMYKFRSMAQDAESKTGPVWAKESDPRVTRIGSFLRSTHLDELPQLVNILKGEMSFVGPRPERPFFVNRFRDLIPHYDRRLCAKPGVTGLAQIRNNYDETLGDVKRKLKYDVLYIQRMCPLLDVKVIALTVGAVILRTGR